MDRIYYWLWLAEGLGPGCRGTGRLLAQWPDPRRLYEYLAAGGAVPRGITPRAAQTLHAVRPEYLAGRVQYCASSGIAILTPDSPDYPRRLLDLPDLPLILYATGNTACLNGRRYVGMVGTRRPTAYGSHACRDLSAELARQGIVIVSGLADGLDGEGHRAAVREGACTVAFLGTAINHTYPAVNRELRSEMERLGGAVLSEYPPDYPGRMTGTFLARNRLIAGLSEVLCVAEARMRSGTLNTVGHAEQYGRPVLAVPGSIYSPSSAGTNELLRTGRAGVLCRAADVLARLGMPCDDARPPRAPHQTPPSGLSREARTVLTGLGPQPLTPGELAAATALPVQTVLAALTELELNDAAVAHPGGRYTAVE